MKNQINIFAQGIHTGDGVDGLTVPGTPWASFLWEVGMTQRETNLKWVLQMTDEQVAKVESVLKALLIKDYDEVERLYREYFQGETLDRLMADLVGLRARHA